MELDKSRSSVFANIPMEVLVPFVVDCLMQVAGDLRAILAPVAEWWEANRAGIIALEQRLESAKKAVWTEQEGRV